MGKEIIFDLHKYGQSMWFDYISRSLIKNGRLKELINMGITGMTSNPTIFDKAVKSGNDYDEPIRHLHKTEKSTFEIYDELTVEDVRKAADIFKAVYEKTNRLDGYVSLEINPELAYKTEETIEEGKRLHRKVNRPNVMFKVPSTEEGFEVVEELTASGINVNVTLIFSLEQYEKTVKAYLNGLRRFIDTKKDAKNIRSVASIFVSRVDTVVDDMLKEESLKGKAAVSNSKIIYNKYQELFSSNEFKKLQASGANIQRVLWASTGTKNPDYSDIKYVAELIGKGTVNTVPEPTFNAFLDHGSVEEALPGDVEEALAIINELRRIGIDISKVCKKLLDDGVAAFEKSFLSLLNSIDEKTARVCST